MAFNDYPWGEPNRDLAEVETFWTPRIVAVLNVWNDLEELKISLPTWFEYVDQLIVVDGAYEGTAVANSASDDGTLEYLNELPQDKVFIVECQNMTQVAKRNEAWAYGQDGDVFFIVDADEHVAQGEQLRKLPQLDVGWVRVRSPLYRRTQNQPRLIRWRPSLRYDQRHHWLYLSSHLLATHQKGGAGFNHRAVDLQLYNTRGVMRDRDREQKAAQVRAVQTRVEMERGPQVTAHEPLRILQMGPFDAGFVVSRLSTAINTTTPHESAATYWPQPPLIGPMQFDWEEDRAHIADLYCDADVLHFHVNRFANTFLDLGLRSGARVMHHHGTEYRRDAQTWNMRDDQDGIHLRLVSNLELLQYGERLHYLPNPVAAQRLFEFALELRSGAWYDRPSGTFVVGHSPTKRQYKATDVLLRVADRLRQKKVNVEVQLIEGQPLKRSLEMKAHCDAVFDSFWLGMQSSGIEGAAMGLPVIAGDPDCAREFTKWVGEVPYTFANDEQQLEEQLTRLATDHDYYRRERIRVETHVRTYHDSAAVAAEYLTLLNNAVEWQKRLQLNETLRLPMRVPSPSLV